MRSWPALTVLTSFALSVWSVRRLLRARGRRDGLRFTQPYLGFDWIEVGRLPRPDEPAPRQPLGGDDPGRHRDRVASSTSTPLGYMAHDPEQVRYFSYLNLFTFFMLLLVLGGNLPLHVRGLGRRGALLVPAHRVLVQEEERVRRGQEGVHRQPHRRRGPDPGHDPGLPRLRQPRPRRPRRATRRRWRPRRLGQFGPVTAVCLLLFVGACGKSAQIPLHVWLPDAMEGPTPVSALIHAATMVTAGVYMVARLAPLFSALGDGHDGGGRGGHGHRGHGRHHRPRADRHQEGAGLLHGQPARLHVPGLRRGRLRGGRLPPLHPRLLQGPALPRLGLGHPRPRRRAGHAAAWAACGGASRGRSGRSSSGTLAIAGIPPLAGYFSKDAILAGALGEPPATSSSRSAS